MRVRIGLAALTLALCTGFVKADVQVGDKPALKFKDFKSHKSVDLADLKGKIVVVDFWATWCGPCMGEAGHMVQVNQQYADKGVQFLGISLDEDPSSLTNVIKEKQFTWPMSFEGKAWDGSLPKTWGVNSIPQTFIIGPDGAVLWRGHPANLDRPLALALQQHPPTLVDPATVTAANAILDKIEKAMADNDISKALKLLATVPPDARLNTDFAERFKGDSEKLTEAGNTKLTEADALIGSKQYGQASSELRELSLAFAGNSIGADAKKKLAALNSDPKIRKEIAAQQVIADSSDALETAKQLQADKKDELAYPRFKQIVKQYPGTPAATEAAAIAKQYEADKTFYTAYNLKNNSKRAESMLSMADAYRTAGKPDKAKVKYQDVIEEFPETPWAETAKKAIDGLSAATN